MKITAMTPIFRRTAPVRSLALLALLLGSYLTAQAVEAQEPVAQQLVERGAYLALAADCAGCHSAPQGESYAGGVALNTPIGVVYTTNITPDLETGIGRYSEDAFQKAMREGVAKDGHHLYPAMPYVSYAKLSQEDLMALHAYFMRGVKAVHRINHQTRLSWPLSQRSLMALWNALYLEKGSYRDATDQSPSWNRGAYLVQGLGHCGECHTPRGVAGQLTARSERDGSNYLAGATLDHWRASPLAGAAAAGLSAWSRDEIVEFLKTGRTDRVAALGPMSEVVGKSCQYLSDPDLNAIAEYLLSLPVGASQRAQPAQRPSEAGGASETTRALRSGRAEMRGARSYLDNCNACHHLDGAGSRRTFPSLVKNAAVNARDPVSLIHLVLAGSAMPSTRTAPSALAMPGLGWRLSDAELADLLSFVRGSFGNDAPQVSRAEVARLRKALARQIKTQ